MLPAIHCSFLSTATFKMASEALMAKMGRGVMDRKFLPWHQNVPINCWHFPTKTRGAVFHQIPGDFYPSAKSEFSVWFLRCIKAFCVSQKILCTTDGIFGHQRCTFQTEYSVSDYIFCSVPTQAEGGLQSPLPPRSSPDITFCFMARTI